MPECDQIKLDNSTTMEKADETNEIFTNATTLSPLAKIIAHIEKKNEKLKIASKKPKLPSFKLCQTSLNDGYKVAFLSF
uniref:Uncharacterized protein n=1 Tax=Caenorhabditis japonica TaxID=281687 RepID=A0A8R1IS86_CAEJA